MDKITLQSEPLSAKVLKDKRIIYGISALFASMLIACFVVMVKSVG